MILAISFPRLNQEVLFLSKIFIAHPLFHELLINLRSSETLEALVLQVMEKTERVMECRKSQIQFMLTEIDKNLLSKQSLIDILDLVCSGGLYDPE
jgi:hypothetical protein